MFTYGTSPIALFPFILFYFIICLSSSVYLTEFGNACSGVTKTITCESHHHKLEECTVPGIITILSLQMTELDHHSCNYFSGSADDYSGNDRAYGYAGQTVWVTEDCKASFDVCGGKCVVLT